MLSEEMFFTTKTDVRSIDIPTMFEMSDDDYRKYVRGGLLFVDHHDVLRAEPAGFGLAATREQLDILILELRALRSEIPAKTER
jgi:hypothetical protein